MKAKNSNPIKGMTGDKFMSVKPKAVKKFPKIKDRVTLE